MRCADPGRVSVLLLSREGATDRPSEMLRAAGIGSVFVARDERTAHHLLHQEPIDVAVCDADADWTASLSFARNLRSAPDETRSLLPIVVLASEASVQRTVAARNAGVHQIVSTTMPPAELASELTELLSHPRPFVRDGGYFGPSRGACHARVTRFPSVENAVP